MINENEKTKNLHQDTVIYVQDHEDNHIMIEQHVDVIKDLHYLILDSKNKKAMYVCVL